MPHIEQAIKYAKAAHLELREALHLAKQVDGMIILRLLDDAARLERLIEEYHGYWKADNAERKAK